MSRVHSSTKRTFTHLNEFQRGTLEFMLNRNYSVQEIAHELGVHRSTIYREIKRGTTTQIVMRNGFQIEVQVYLADRGQAMARKGRQARIVDPLKAYSKRFFEELEKALKLKPRVHSVETFVVTYVRANPMEVIPSISTVYNFINAGLLAIKRIDLPRAVRFKRRSKRYAIQNAKHLKEQKRSIEQRPDEINKRTEQGHWEIDLMIGKRGVDEPVIMTLLERVTRYFIAIKLPNACADTVNKALEELHDRFGEDHMKSITADNGSEFLKLYLLTGMDIYYAHPYSSFERGSNEVHNGLLREFIPKGKSFRSYSQEEIQKMADALNHRPRKMFGYRTPYECFWLNKDAA